MNHFLLDPTFTSIEYITIQEAVDNWKKALNIGIILEKVYFPYPFIGKPENKEFVSNNPRIIKSTISQLSFLWSNGLHFIKGHRDRKDIWLATDVDVDRLLICTMHELGHFLGNRGDHISRGIMSWNGGNCNKITKYDIEYVQNI